MTIFYIIFYIFTVLLMAFIIKKKNTIIQEQKKSNKILKEKILQEITKNRERDKIMLYQSRFIQNADKTSLFISHHWKQLLNNLAIINQNFYLKYEKNKLSQDVVEKFFETSKMIIEQISKTIDDFNNFFQFHKNIENFSINLSILHLLDLTKVELDKHNIYVQKNCDDEIYIEGYKNEFIQAVSNIIQNAKDALVEKHIFNKKITITLKREENNILLVIQDNAGGIDPKILNKIFDPYISTRGKKHTGLGLYMTKVILEEHMGAKISAYNNTEGAVFEIIFNNS